jgi:signal transduction histidine kinase
MVVRSRVAPRRPEVENRAGRTETWPCPSNGRHDSVTGAATLGRVVADTPDLRAGAAFDGERWVRALHNLYLVTLLIAVITTVTSTVGPRPLAPVGLWLLAVPATVVLAVGDLVVRRWALDARPGAATGYFVAVAVVVGTLTALFPTFGMVDFGALPLVLVVLRRHAAVAVSAVLTLLPYVVQPYVLRWLFGAAAPADVMLHIGPAYTAMVGVALPMLTGLFTVGAVRSAHRQGRARQTAVEQLWAARTELAAAARTAGQSEERQRLAHELHDTLAQGLSGVILQLEAAEQHLQDDLQDGAGAAERLARLLDRALETARICLTDTRRAVAALRPEPLDGATLADAITQVCRQVGALSGLPIHRTLRGSARRLAARLEVDVLRVAQEALANAVKHAAATEVTVTLDYRPDELVLTVHDNGRGFHPDRPPAGDGGLGLSTMRERVTSAGGRLTVDSRPGAGTTVTAVTPDPSTGRVPS